MKIRMVSLLCLSLFVETAQASLQQTPPWLVHTWFGTNIGYTNVEYSNQDLTSEFVARHIETPSIALQGHMGHYFSPYFGAEFSLLRTLGDPKYIGILNHEDSHHVLASVFTLTLRPTLPLPRDWVLYGEAGVGYTSRRGFQILGVNAISTTGIFSPLLGGGVSYDVGHGIFLDLNTRYIFANNGMKQPSLFFTGLGFYYLLGPSAQKEEAGSTAYHFPLNLIQLGYYNRDLAEVNAATYFSPPYIPIFFQGKINVKDGLILMYMRNFFHTQKNFSLEWGVSGARYASRYLKQDFYTLSIFPEWKVWIARCPRFDLYFTYSIAGPTYISRRFIDNINSGESFTFQDFLGLGAFVGSGKHVSIDLKIFHYSNGNLFTANPGIKIPVLFSAGYAW